MTKRIVALLLAALALLSLASCAKQAEAPELKPSLRDDYDTAQVRRGSVKKYKQYMA